MPLQVKKVKSGFKVCDDKGQCLSKKPLSKKQATKQELAVRLSTLRKEGRIPPQKGKGAVLNRVGSDIANVGKAGVKAVGSAIASKAGDVVSGALTSFANYLKTPLTPEEKAAALAKLKASKEQKGKGFWSDVGNQISKQWKEDSAKKDAEFKARDPVGWAKKEKIMKDVMSKYNKPKVGTGNFFEDALRFTNPTFDMAMRARDTVIKGNGDGYNQSSFAVLKNQKVGF